MEVLFGALILLIGVIVGWAMGRVGLGNSD